MSNKKSDLGQVRNIGAIDFLRQTDHFVLSTDDEQGPEQNSPHVIKAPLFSGRTVKSRIANIITTVPLRLVRKSTMDYYTYQNQLNHEFKQEISILHKRIDILSRQNTER